MHREVCEHVRSMQLNVRHQHCLRSGKTHTQVDRRSPGFPIRASADTSKRAKPGTKSGPPPPRHSSYCLCPKLSHAVTPADLPQILVVCLAEPGLGLKAAWTAAEQIGNVVGLSSPSDGQEAKSRSGVKQVRGVLRKDRCVTCTWFRRAKRTHACGPGILQTNPQNHTVESDSCRRGRQVRHSSRAFLACSDGLPREYSCSLRAITSTCRLHQVCCGMTPYSDQQQLCVCRQRSAGTMPSPPSRPTTRQTTSCEHRCHAFSSM